MQGDGWQNVRLRRDVDDADLVCRGGLDRDELAVGTLRHEVTGTREADRSIDDLHALGVSHLDSSIQSGGDEGVPERPERRRDAVDDAESGTGLEVPERRRPQLLVADEQQATIGRYEEQQSEITPPASISRATAPGGDGEEVLGTGITRAQVPAPYLARAG